ncbi:MAG: hypothetical protein ACJ8EL_07555 [Rhizomicrobium sp.]
MFAIALLLVGSTISGPGAALQRQLNCTAPGESQRTPNILVKGRLCGSRLGSEPSAAFGTSQNKKAIGDQRDKFIFAPFIYHRQNGLTLALCVTRIWNCGTKIIPFATGKPALHSRVRDGRLGGRRRRQRDMHCCARYADSLTSNARRTSEPQHLVCW